jgi:hypothetical protein
MMTPYQALIVRAFKNFPVARAAFCAAEGIDPTGADDAGLAPAVDNTRPRPAPMPGRYDGTPGDSQGRDAKWRGDDADPEPRSVEGKRNPKSLSALPMGPVRGPDGVLRIHACCPREWRRERGYPEPA